MKKRSSDEASVSDVLGSILLVGITVIMAGAFGAVLLSYKGPVDQQHTQLAISVGPGADGIWTNGAEIKMTNIGGEDLVQGRTRVTYVDTAGSHAVTPTFTGGKLKLGQSWIQTGVTASPGVQVSVTVVTDLEEGGGAVVSSGGVTAGGSGATLTYVGTATPAAGKGSIDAPGIGPAQATGDNDAAAVLREGGVASMTTLAPSATTGTVGGALNPNNVCCNTPDQYAVLDNSGEYVEANGFSPPAGSAVAALALGMEGKYVPSVSTVAYRALSLQSSITPSGSTIATPSILGLAGDVYMLAVANGGTSVRTIVGLPVGPPGISWSLVGHQVNSPTNNGNLDLYVGTGTPSIAGTITVTFSGVPDKAAIAVSRYSGVDTTNPIQGSISGEATGGGSTSVSLGTVLGTSPGGLFYAAINAATTSTSNVPTTSPATERAELNPSSNKIKLIVADSDTGSGGGAGATNTVTTGTISSADWEAIGVTLRPIISTPPSVVVSYTLAGCTCPTTLTQPLTTTDPAAPYYTQSIFADRAWTLADLAGIAVRVTYPTDTGSDVYIDRVFLDVTYTASGASFSTQIDLAFSAVPNLPTQVFQMRYKVAGDTFNVYAMTGASPRLCPGVLNAASLTVFTCALSVGEYNSGSPVIRITDLTPTGTAQGVLTVEYARMSSS